MLKSPMRLINRVKRRILLLEPTPIVRQAKIRLKLTPLGVLTFLYYSPPSLTPGLLDQSQRLNEFRRYDERSCYE
jgi:hypothetical protein